ncbi:hypothetical protein FOZ60_002662 [Perkinsus olseni]|uniref:Uncharacterized protein n=1 Tax=Perkinsus olseni TaxID=32597 RepID=A0A7J6PIF4_PEROL|nr:hypothetical protein FOZ60_002662 [Perkinsus olseni]
MVTLYVMSSVLLLSAVFGHPPPPTGSFHKVIADDPVPVCAHVTWSDDSQENISLGVKCGDLESEVDFLTATAVSSRVYKLANNLAYHYFRSSVNKGCNGLVDVQDGDFLKLDYNGYSQTMMIPFMGVEHRFTVGKCF